MANILIYNYEKWYSQLEPRTKEAVSTTIRLGQYGLVTGFILGGFSGGRQASLQFLAEHQHELAGIRTPREAQSFLRLRNARIAWGFGRIGFWRGVQLGAVAAFYGTARAATHHLAHTIPLPIWHQRNGRRIDATVYGDVIAGGMTGSLFALAAGAGQKFYYLRKGVAMGVAFGAVLVFLREFAIRLGNAPSAPVTSTVAVREINTA